MSTARSALLFLATLGNQMVLSFVPWQKDPDPSSGLLSSKQSHEVEIAEGPFHPSQISGCWGRKPILIRKAFDASALLSTKAWPSRDDIQSWACYSEESVEEDEMPIMSRLIQKESDQLDSFTLEIGPFDRCQLDELDGTKGLWTLLLNDVERIHPPLNAWMNRVFGADFFPRWRLDDGQISIANSGGGIGPHVDNYDVFLVQTSGSREWLLGDFISTEQEMENLIDGLEVRILDLGDVDAANKVVVTAGDLLYLPPRLVHHGSALSDDCMTLSVGCRAPSASELVSRVAEHLAYSLAPAAVRRYTDNNLLTNPIGSADPSPESITSEVKDDMKRLVLDAVHDILDDPIVWDEIVGCLATEPKRPMDTFSIYDEEDDPEQSSMEDLKTVLVNGEGALLQMEGVTFATSQQTKEGYTLFRVFADGQMFEWTAGDGADKDSLSSRMILSAIKQGLPLTRTFLGGSQINADAMSVLGALLRGGFYYVDEESGKE